MKWIKKIRRKNCLGNGGEDVMTEQTVEEIKKGERIDKAFQEFSRTFPEGSPYILQNLFQFYRKDDFFILPHTENFNNSPHTHPFFEIVYVAAGDVEEYVDQEKVCLQEGDVCIHKPGSGHKITKFKDEDDILINILMSKDAFLYTYYEPLMQNSGLNYFFSRFITASSNAPSYILFPRATTETECRTCREGEPSRSLPRGSSLRNTSSCIDTLIEMISVAYLRNDHSSRIICNGLFLALFGELMRNETYNFRSAEIMNYMADHINEVTLKSTAAHFGYHEKYFSNILKKETGRGFQQLVTDIRLTRAASLLTYTDFSIEDIALKVGYVNASSLYINFSKYFGVTPNAYRMANK